MQIKDYSVSLSILCTLVYFKYFDGAKESSRTTFSGAGGRYRSEVIHENIFSKIIYILDMKLKS